MTLDEVKLVNMMLTKANRDNYRLNSHVEHLIASGCDCGCASFDFLSESSEQERNSRAGVIADFSYKIGDITFGILLTANEKELIDLEVWSPDSSFIPAELPLADQIFEFQRQS